MMQSNNQDALDGSDGRSSSPSYDGQTPKKEPLVARYPGVKFEGDMEKLHIGPYVEIHPGANIHEGVAISGRSIIGCQATIRAGTLHNTIVEGVVEISGGDLTGCTISDSHDSGETIRGSKIFNSNISGGTIRGSIISDSNISEGTIEGSKVSGGTINGSDIEYSVVKGGVVFSATLYFSAIHGRVDCGKHYESRVNADGRVGCGRYKCCEVGTPVHPKIGDDADLKELMDLYKDTN